MHVLVVEDDPRLSRLLKRLLEDDRHVVEVATDGTSGLEIAEDAPGIECVILDIGLPDISGLEVAKRLRTKGSEVTILMLTARDTVGDRVAGLDAGADDYLVKPFAYEELSARLRALGRRGSGTRRPEPKLIAGPIVLDETMRRVTLDGKTIDLSPREFSLLECLLRHPGQTLSRDQLLDQAWPFSVAVTPNAVDAYVHYLREKLGAAGRLIETVRGVGYRLADAGRSPATDCADRARASRRGDRRATHPPRPPEPGPVQWRDDPGRAAPARGRSLPRRRGVTRKLRGRPAPGRDGGPPRSPDR